MQIRTAFHRLFASLIALALMASTHCSSDPDGVASNAGSAGAGGVGVDSGPCIPSSCAQMGVECGEVMDGCDGVISCGSCPTGQICGGDGPNRCGVASCVPSTCSMLGAECGAIQDECASVLSCGDCPGGELCGEETPNRCGIEGTGGAAGDGGSGGLGGTGGSSCPGECTPNQVESGPCGDCDTGSHERTCGADCAWPSWGPCTGVTPGFPYEPTSSTAVCPPYDRPAVFFSPHPDDESLAMAAAIIEHVDSGRDVFMELLTHGEASGVRDVLSNGASCPWHSGTHQHPLSVADFGHARVREFLDAVERMGVRGVYVSNFGDGNLTQSEVSQRLRYWIDRGDANLSLKGIATTGTSDHPDHRAQWLAMLGIGFSDVRGYSHTLGDPEGSTNPIQTINISTWCDRKRDALNAYKLWDPAAGRYAIGYHSVPAMHDERANNCVEYRAVP